MFIIKLITTIVRNLYALEPEKFESTSFDSTDYLQVVNRPSSSFQLFTRPLIHRLVSYENCHTVHHITDS